MKFSTFAVSVHGKKYRERGLPCQDSSDVLEFDNVQAIAVADGHGGRDYFRSDTGSRLAVQVAFEQVKKFCNDISEDETFSENSIRNFELELWEGWQKAVKDDWSKNPNYVEEERWQNVSDKYKARYTSADERYIPVAYGTTLLLAVSIGWQVLFVQIGDGSCVVLQKDGEFKLPVPPDGESFGYVTTSLCDADGYKKFRHAVLDCAEDSPLAPVAIFLSTDGLDDCYPIGDNEKYLYKLYANTVIDSMIENGFDKTRESLREELLPYMTEHGSNDDISLAYLVTDDLALLRRTFEQPPPPVEEMQAKVAKQAAKVRQRLLPLWWEERRKHYDKQPRPLH